MSDLDRNFRNIRPKDLIFVILYGGVISLLFGVLIGFIDYYLLSLIGFSFSILLFFFTAQYIGGLVRKQYETPHLVYSIITGVFLVVQAIIINGLPIIYSLARDYGDIMLVFNVRMYISYFWVFLRSIVTDFHFNYVIMILAISVGTYLGIRKTYE